MNGAHVNLERMRETEIEALRKLLKQKDEKIEELKEKIERLVLVDKTHDLWIND